MSSQSPSEIVVNLEPERFSNRARTIWQQQGEYHEASLDDPKVWHWAERATVAIVRLGLKVDQAVLDRMPNVRYLVSATTGLDHLDMEALDARGVTIISLRGEQEFLSTIPSTAEHAFALLLSLVRNIPSAVQSVERGEWDRNRFRGRQLKSRKLGIVGLGRTGRMMAEFAAAFGMDVSYFDPYVTEGRWARFDSLSALLGQADIVSLHVHLMDTTAGMLGKSQFDSMRQGALLINTSRGALVDEAAAVESLRLGRLGGIATDVLASELTDIESSPLLAAMRTGLPVIITPHLGGATTDAMHACEEFIAQKFLRVRACEQAPGSAEGS